MTMAAEDLDHHAPGKELRRAGGSHASGLSTATAEHPRTVGAFGLALLTFFNVSGGPWGSEPVVSMAGPYYGFICLFGAALCWGLPLCLVTSELSSALPNNGGYVLWVDTAFGGFWGFQESFWSWGSCVVDNALYPVLAYETFIAMYLGDVSNPLDADVLESMNSWYFAYACKFFLTILFSLPVLVGKTEWITKGMAIMVVLLTIPFAVMLPYIVWTRPMDWTQLWKVRHVGKSGEGIDWVELFHVTFWNFNGFDCASTCAGEVKNPGRSYPLGLLSALVVTVLMVLIPLMVATAANTPDWSLWEVGWWSTIANENAGSGFAWAVVISSVIGTFGMHSAVMWEDSWQLCGMAEQGLAPRWLAKRNEKLGTPENATLVSMLMVCLLIMFDFRSMVIIDNFFSMASGLLELAAFVHLKRTRSEADLPRPFRVPFVNSDWSLFVFMVPPTVVGVVIISTSFDDGWTSVLMLLPVMALGMVLPIVFGRQKPMKGKGLLRNHAESNVSASGSRLKQFPSSAYEFAMGKIRNFPSGLELAHSFEPASASPAPGAGGLYGALGTETTAGDTPKRMGSWAEEESEEQSRLLKRRSEGEEEGEEANGQEEDSESEDDKLVRYGHYDSIFTPTEVLEDHAVVVNNLLEMEQDLVRAQEEAEDGENEGRLAPVDEEQGHLLD